ncbi:MAG: metal-dependent hydrolase [Kiritimatiellales bacterium]
MANGKTHASLGVVAGTVADTMFQIQRLRAGEQEEFSLPEVLGAGLVGYLGGTLVDILEPASIGGSWHRKSLHSFAGCACLVAAACLSENKNTAGYRLLKVFVAAHLSHLFLDVQTPRGLPWIHPKADKLIGLKALRLS